MKQTTLLPLKRLLHNPSNPRTITKAKLDKLVQSLRQFPQMLHLRPIVVESLDNPVVLGGNMRLKALQQLGVEEVPVLTAEELTPEQRAEFIIKDNVGLGDWDWEVLANEWDPIELQDWGTEIPDLKEVKPEIIEDNIPELPDEPLTKLGDVWILGEHKILCGDITEPEQIENLMKEKNADMIWTDPPYNVAVEGKAGKIKNDDMTQIEFKNFMKKTYEQIHKKLKNGGVIYVAHSEQERVIFTDELVKAGFKFSQNLIWVKQSATLSRQDFNWQHEPILYGWKKGAGHFYCQDFTNTTIIEDQATIEDMKKNELVKYTKMLLEKITSTTIKYNRPTRSELHPTMKPVGLVAKMIGWSSKKNEIVLDPFLGSGTTLIAAEQLGRRCYGMELDPKYCDVIVARWEKLTGKQAVRSININDHDQKETKPTA